MAILLLDIRIKRAFRDKDTQFYQSCLLLNGGETYNTYLEQIELDETAITAYGIKEALEEITEEAITFSPQAHNTGFFYSVNDARIVALSFEDALRYDFQEDEATFQKNYNFIPPTRP